MNKIIFFCFGFFSFNFADAQYCDEFNAQNFIHTTNIWDWRDDSPNNWMAYVINDDNSLSAIYLPSPFEAALFTQPNTEHLFITSNERDFETSDGWELVYKSFGVGLGPNEYVENPGFVLHNRFRGVLRIFLYAQTDVGNGLSAGRLRFKFSNGSDKQSAALAYAKSFVDALDQFEKDILASVPNDYQNPEGGRWFMADIPVAYDPCTCANSINEVNQLTPNISSMEVGGDFIQEGTINLISEQTTVNTPIADGNAPAGSNKSIIDLYNGAVKEGNAVQANFAKWVENTDNFIQTAIHPLDNPESVDHKKWILPEAFRGLPYIFETLKIIDFLVRGGSEVKKTTVPSQPTKTKYTGSVCFAYPMNGFVFYTPGSPHQSITDTNPESKPIYDHTLGIVNLVETPVLEWVQYNCEQGHFLDVVDESNGENVPCVAVVDHPQIRQYRLKTMPKFAINPASELELIDLEFALDYTLNDNVGNAVIPITGNAKDVVGNPNTGGACTNPFWCVFYPFIGPVITEDLDQIAPGMGYAESLLREGIEVVKWPKPDANSTSGVDNINKITYSTGYFSASCWQEYSALFAHHPINASPPFSYDGDLNVRYNNPEFRLRVKYILKRTDNDADVYTDNVILIATYKVKLEESTLNAPFSNDPESAHTYKLSISNYEIHTSGGLSSFETAEAYGHTFWVEALNKSNGVGPVFPIGYQAHPYDLDITGIVNLESAESKYATHNIKISATITNQDNLVNSDILARNEIAVMPESNLSGNMTLKLDDLNACSHVLSLATIPSWIEQNICNQAALYNPITPRSTEVVGDVETEIDFILHPNPAEDVTNLDWSNKGVTLVRCEIHNSIGQLIEQFAINEVQGNKIIDTSALAEGLYKVTLRSSNGAKTTTLAII